MGERYAPFLPRDREDELRRIAKVLVAPGKGILAADESNNSMHKRLDMIKMENNEENRRQYRQMLLCCGKEMSEHIGGVILFHETVYQKADDGVSFVKHLQQNGVVPGIKVRVNSVYRTRVYRADILARVNNSPWSRPLHPGHLLP